MRNTKIILNSIYFAINVNNDSRIRFFYTKNQKNHIIETIVRSYFSSKVSIKIT